MINLTIDGQVVSIKKGTTVYQAAKQLGIEIPIFCYQDRMPPFGACRMCLVEVEKMAKLQTACTLEATDGMIVKTNSNNAEEGRKHILELLLINHPLDCPICDRGGECPLQDNTMKYGPGMSRFFEQKRHFKKRLALSPVLMLDRERCITCARCTRFSEHISGDHALEFLDRGYKTEVGVGVGASAQSKFIGNTIMICPVGALTSQAYRFRARPWDNDVNHSNCTLCPIGCSLIFDARDGQIVRTRAHEDRDVNDIWMCDKGWFGYEFADHVDRLTTPLIRKAGTLVSTSWEEAFTYIADKIKPMIAAGKLAAWGGNPLTLEENYLLQKFMRSVLSSNHIDHRLGIPLFDKFTEGLPAGMEISIGACEQLSFILLLGVDLTEEFPIIWLRLRKALHNGAIVIFIGHFAPEIAQYFTKTILHKPGSELESLKQAMPLIASFIKNDQNNAVFVGKQYLNNIYRSDIFAQLLQLRQTGPTFSINVLEGSNNSHGAHFAGMRPDCGPNNQNITTIGLNSQQVLEQAVQDGWDFLYVVGANPALKFSTRLWNAARSKLGCLVVQDLFMTETALQADVVLPTLCYIEKTGTFINIEGRLRKLHPGKAIPTQIYSDGEIFIRLAQKLGQDLAIDDNFLHLIVDDHLPQTALADIKSTSTNTSLPLNENDLFGTYAQPLFDHDIRMQHNPHLLALVQEPYVRCHPNEAIKRHIQDGEQAHLSSNGHVIMAVVKYDPSVAEQTVVFPLGFSNRLPIQELEANGWNGFLIEMTRAEHHEHH